MNLEQLTAFFWANVEKSDIPGECWLWTGGLTSRGHGVMIVERNKHVKRAHRFSWELHKNVRLSSKRLIGHTCGVKTCVNPEHLTIVKHSHWHIKDPPPKR